ncbi:hypothetical protein GCM10022600_15220 [Qipengyuania pelagi]|uniref:Uncharacterized protein n=1 Tax=Qipengyuania pelagi TaxID=994320 RepID=A0A844Y8L9_9SPHN|nr:hypothetical protein [Qipengyuania pelagi]MXO53623.1 hypothetical protein [Qipengyuania pelagi]
MLSHPADFPHVGSRAFVVGTAEPVTILRANADGSRMVRRDGTRLHPASRDASGNRTLPLSDLAPTEAEAFDTKPKPRRCAKGRAGR